MRNEPDSKVDFEATGELQEDLIAHPPGRIYRPTYRSPWGALVRRYLRVSALNRANIYISRVIPHDRPGD